MDRVRSYKAVRLAQMLSYAIVDFTNRQKDQSLGYRLSCLKSMSALWSQRNIFRSTSKCRYVRMNPFHCKPLIFETEIPGYIWFIACQKSKRRETVAYVHPYFWSRNWHVLSLSEQGVRGPKLKKSFVPVSITVTWKFWSFSPAMEIHFNRKRSTWSKIGRTCNIQEKSIAINPSGLHAQFSELLLLTSPPMACQVRPLESWGWRQESNRLLGRHFLVEHYTSFQRCNLHLDSENYQ